MRPTKYFTTLVNRINVRGTIMYCSLFIDTSYYMVFSLLHNCMEEKEMEHRDIKIDIDEVALGCLAENAS